MSKENYDAIKRIKDLQERDAKRTIFADKFAQTVVPQRKAKEQFLIEQTLVNMKKRREKDEIEVKKKIEAKKELKANYIVGINA